MVLLMQVGKSREVIDPECKQLPLAQPHVLPWSKNNELCYCESKDQPSIRKVAILGGERKIKVIIK